MRCSCKLLLAGLLLTALCPRPAASSAEKRLTTELLQKYKDWGVVGRPVRNSSHVLTVRLGLALVQILDLQENQQRLRTNCWLRFAWKDSLLSWENWTRTEYQEVQQIRVQASQIWTPDIKLYNFADDRLREKRDARVVVQKNGEILWIPQALLKSTCKVKLLNFPFDTQHCNMRFGSWTYDETQLRLDWGVTDLRLNDTFTIRKPLPYVDFGDYVKSNEWATDGELEVDVADPEQRHLQIRSRVRHRNETAYDRHGQLVMRRYRILEYRIRMMRNPSFYVAILVVPCILLSMLTLVLFWLPPESPAKMLLGMNVFVAFFILLLLLAELIPSAVEAFPLIGCYYCVNMGMITFSTFVAVLIVNLHFHGDRSGPVPPLVKRVMIEGLGRLFLIKRSIPIPIERRLLLRQNSAESSCSRGGRGRSFKVTDLGGSFKVSDHGGSSLGSCRKAVYSEAASRQPGLLLTCPPQVEDDLREVSRFIRVFLGRKKDASAKNSIAIEWRTLALVLDRLFFILYLILIVTFLIVFIPRRAENVHTTPEEE